MRIAAIGSKRRMHATQRGVAVVEFTIALPLLLLLFMAVAEFGRAFLQYSTLTHSVRDSARFVASKALRGQAGTVYLDTPLVTSARNLAVYGNAAGTGEPLLPGLTGANVTVRDLGGGNISVVVAYPYQPMIGTALPNVLGGSDFATNFTLSAEVVVRAIS